MTRDELAAWWAGLTPEQQAAEIAKAAAENARFTRALDESDEDSNE
jgi:hypothetical protein